jgi:hypothetical protein
MSWSEHGIFGTPTCALWLWDSWQELGKSMSVCLSFVSLYGRGLLHWDGVGYQCDQQIGHLASCECDLGQGMRLSCSPDKPVFRSRLSVRIIHNYITCLESFWQSINRNDYFADSVLAFNVLTYNVLAYNMLTYSGGLVYFKIVI